jgi:hypothetical protein
MSDRPGQGFLGPPKEPGEERIRACPLCKKPLFRRTRFTRKSLEAGCATGSAMSVPNIVLTLSSKIRCRFCNKARSICACPSVCGNCTIFSLQFFHLPTEFCNLTPAESYGVVLSVDSFDLQRNWKREPFRESSSPVRAEPRVLTTCQYQAAFLCAWLRYRSNVRVLQY